jgi:phosphoglycolate phosphatase
VNSKTSSITTLLFDWDGTVVNSAKPGLQAFEQSFAELGVYFDHEIYQAVYSPNWYSVYEAMGLPKEKWQMADDLWVQYYGEQTAEPLPGAQQTISELNGKGYRLGVVSSGNERRVTRELNQLGLASFFETLVCHEHMQNKKPHPEGLETAMRLLACTSEVVCYVGDSPEDIQMGKRAKVFTVGVRSDYPTSWKLQSHGPDILIDSLSELLSHF